MFVMRSPREVLASKLAARVPVSKSGACLSSPSVWAASGPRTPPIGFSKRCVPVASCSVVLRSVAYESPKNALRGAFKKTRRAAQTTRFTRMSRRLAGTNKQESEMAKYVPQSRQQPAPFKSRSSAWRSVSSVVNDVLRDVRISQPALQACSGGESKVQ